MTFEELYAKVKRSTADDLTNERIYNLIIDETVETRQDTRFANSSYMPALRS